MPLVWAMVLIQVGYLKYLLCRKVKMLEAMLLCMIIGMVFITESEQCAYWVEWWFYNPCHLKNIKEDYGGLFSFEGYFAINLIKRGDFSFRYPFGREWGLVSGGLIGI